MIGSSQLYIVKDILKPTAEYGETAMECLTSSPDASEQIYRVVLIKNRECILTPGELPLDKAKKKSSYLSQYGQVALLDVHKLSDKIPSKY